MRWREEALTKGCLEAAEKLRRFPWLNSFYLAGGTALALLYGHRISVDLDFFSNTNPLKFENRQPPVKDLISIGARIDEEKDGALHARYKGTLLSFFQYIYPLLRETKHWRKIQVASPEDISLMKVGAIIGRGSRKDFFDLYTLLQQGLSLSQLLKLSKKKFQGVRDFPLQAFRALVYFEDADKEPDPRLIKGVPWEQVKRFFETEVRHLAAPLR